MSGEGVLPVRQSEHGLVDALVAFSWESEARLRERRDVVARLRMKLASARAIAKGNPHEEDFANRLIIHYQTEIDYIAQGLHVGAAAVEAVLGEAA